MTAADTTRETIQAEIWENGEREYGMVDTKECSVLIRKKTFVPMPLVRSM